MWKLPTIDCLDLFLIHGDGDGGIMTANSRSNSLEE